MAPNSRHVPFVADHIANYLNTPDIMFVQEIQDNSGPTDDGVVSANLTLTTLVNAIQEKSGILYSFIDIAPVNNQDGGKSGGNIRQAYLWVLSASPLRSPLTAHSAQLPKGESRIGSRKARWSPQCDGSLQGWGKPLADV